MARAGRKRKLVKRYPSGQPYRPPADAREVVIGARMRQFGYSKDKATHTWAGYEFGRMVINGMFGHVDGQEAHRAIATVEEYVTVVATFMRLKFPMQPMPRAMDFLAGRGLSLDPEPSQGKIEHIEKAYKAVSDKLAPAGGIHRMAFHEVVFHDRECAPDRVIAVETCVRLLQGR